MSNNQSIALERFINSDQSLEHAQWALLQQILSAQQSCRFGQHHNFSAINSPDAYRRLPLMTYDQVAGFPDYWTDTRNFTVSRLSAYFLTSGSSATPKKIPVTSEFVRQKARAFSLFWDAIYRDHPAIKTGRLIANFGDSGHSERNAQNITELSETTFWNQRMQGFQSSERWPIPRQLVAIADASQRYYAAARLALQGELHCLMSLNPSTLVKFCEIIEASTESLARGLHDGTWGIAALDARSDLPDQLTSRLQRNQQQAQNVQSWHGNGRRQLKALWPALELIICWQSELVSPYLDILKRHAEGIAFRDYITQSSECIMAIPMADTLPGGLLAYTSHYYEFIPANSVEDTSPQTTPAWALEKGKRYELVVTTAGGLYRYRTADCLAVTGHVNGVPHLSFQYRFGRTSSITGEKLTEQQVVHALEESGMHEVLARSDVFVYPKTGERPHYAVLVDEAALQPGVDETTLSTWVGRFHEELGKANGEYKDKCGSLRLGEPEVVVTNDDGMQSLHDRFRAKHVGDDQYKPGILRRERDLDSTLSIKTIPDED
ncbi:MAG: GH3 auxin-responsive promoter family protein [Pseudomonadota bacterium]